MTNEANETEQPTKKIAVTIEAWQKGTNLGRIEGYRLIVDALGGELESVHVKPDFGEYWHLDITLTVPPGTQERCAELAQKMFDGGANERVPEPERPYQIVYRKLFSSAMPEVIEDHLTFDEGQKNLREWLKSQTDRSWTYELVRRKNEDTNKPPSE